jgi:hypothetical protein
MSPESLPLFQPPCKVFLCVSCTSGFDITPGHETSKNRVVATLKTSGVKAYRGREGKTLRPYALDRGHLWPLLSGRIYSQIKEFPEINIWASEVLTAVVMKSSIFYDITPCSPLKVNRRFGRTYRLNLQCRRISRAFHLACHLLSRWFLARLILRSWRWKPYAPPKRRLSSNGLHGVISQKTEHFNIRLILLPTEPVLQREESKLPYRDVNPDHPTQKCVFWMSYYRKAGFITRTRKLPGFVFILSTDHDSN